MDSDELMKVIKGEGNQLGEFSPQDPDFDEKYKIMIANRNAYKQARVKLFDRVFDGSATEEEVSMAVAHARKVASDRPIVGFSGGVPKSWYANDRIAAYAVAGVVIWWFAKRTFW